jgi:ParB/RepB/Spo0J family partition protein
MNEKIEVLPLDQIVPLPFNVCTMNGETELMLKSDMTRVETTGMQRIDPILVRRLTPEEIEEYKSKGKLNARLQIVDGHRRWIAASELGWHEIRAIIVDMSLDEAREINYKKNKTRGTVDPLRESAYFHHLHDTLNVPVEKIAEKFGITHRRVEQILSRLKITEKTKRIIRGEIDFTPQAAHYEIVGSVKEPEKQEQLAELMVEEKLSGREAKVAKEALEEGLPKEKAKKVVKAVKRAKLKPKETKALLKIVKEKPEEVDRLTSLSKEEILAEAEGAKVVRTAEEVEEVFERIPAVSPINTYECPCGCGYTLQVNWVERKTEWIKP